MTTHIARALILACCFLIAACSLPRGAAIQSEIVNQSSEEDGEFAVYEVTRAQLSTYANWPNTGEHHSAAWIQNTAGGRGQIIAPGDVISISIWENSENSLLAGPGQPSANIQDSVVSASGKIFVPYVGETRVAGMSPDHARQSVQEMLEDIAPTGQVQLTVTPGRQNSVDLVSGARAPGNFPLSGRTLSVLNLISLGGGVSSDLENPRVTLLRGDRRFTTALSNLYDSPRYDTTLVAGDKIIIEEDERYFLAMGATGSETVISFDKNDITALEAMVMAGGINDGRADPKGVLILREYAAGDLDLRERAGPNNVRAIFTIDLTSADGLFSAGKFQIQPNDLVLATESPINGANIILGLIGRMVGVSNAVGNL